MRARVIGTSEISTRPGHLICIGGSVENHTERLAGGTVTVADRWTRIHDCVTDGVEFVNAELTEGGTTAHVVAGVVEEP